WKSLIEIMMFVFSVMQSQGLFFSSRRRHTRFSRDWSSDVCSSDLFYCVRIMYLNLGREQFDGLNASTILQPAIYLSKASLRSERSEERRVGKEWRSRRSAKHNKKKWTRSNSKKSNR